MMDDEGIETATSVIKRMDKADRALAEQLGITFDPKTTPAELVRLASEKDFQETKVAHEWFAARVAWLDWGFSTLDDSEDGDGSFEN